MRIKFIYKINKVPIDYRRFFLSLIKETLKDENLYTAEKRDTKPFCFSVYFEGSKIKNEIIEIEGNTNLFISSPDMLLLITIYNGLVRNKAKEFPFPNGEKLKRINTFLINEKTINNNEAQFKTMSPVIIVNNNKKPVLHPKTKVNIENIGDIIIDDNIFLKELRYSVKNIIKSSEDVEFIPVDIKKEVIKHSIGEHLKEANKKILLIGFSGKFILRGNRDDLQKIYQLGLGFRRNQGFGMLEVE